MQEHVNHIEQERGKPEQVVEVKMEPDHRSKMGPDWLYDTL